MAHSREQNPGWYTLKPFSWETLRTIDRSTPGFAGTRDYLDRKITPVLGQVPVSEKFIDAALASRDMLLDVLAETFDDHTHLYRLPADKIGVLIRPKREMGGFPAITRPDAPVFDYVSVDFTEDIIQAAWADLALSLQPKSRHVPDMFGLLVCIVSHEFYHVRQFYQDKSYFSEEPQEFQGMVMSLTDLGERGAGATSVRYMKEKVKILSEKHPQTKREKILIRAYTRMVANILSELKDARDIPFPRRHSGV